MIIIKILHIYVIFYHVDYFVLEDFIIIIFSVQSNYYFYQHPIDAFLILVIFLYNLNYLDSFGQINLMIFVIDFYLILKNYYLFFV